MSTWLSFFINLHHYTGITAESLSSTVFRSAGQNQSQIDRLRSVFHLIQARNGTFSQPLFVWKMQGRVMLWRFYKITVKF